MGLTLCGVLTVLVTGAIATPIVLQGDTPQAVQVPPQQVQGQNVSATELTETQVPRNASAISGRRCVFMHGFGYNSSAAPTSSLEEGWGAVHQFTPGCAERIFLHENTVEQAWFDAPLLERFCQVAVGTSKDNVARNTAIFAHSMGALVVGAAFQSKCSFDEKTSTLNLLGFHPPYPDSRCASHNARKFLKLDAPGIHPNIDALFGRASKCIVGDRELCPDLPSEATIQGVSQFLQKASAVSCGTTPEGWSGKEQVTTVADTLGYVPEGENDGLCSASVCYDLVPKEKFQKVPSAPYFLSTAAHTELTCKFGQGTKVQEKVCDWFVFRSLA